MGTAAGYQAAHLMAGDDTTAPIGIECLVDPTKALYRALGLGRVPWYGWFRPQLARNYLGAFRRGGRQGAITGDWRQLSGVAIVAPDRRLTYLHRARTVGDYPSLATVLHHLEAVR